MKTPTMVPPSATYRHKNNYNADLETVRWRWLYKIGGAAALSTVALILIAIVTHIVAHLTIWPWKRISQE